MSTAAEPEPVEDEQPDPKTILHEAITGSLDDGELAISWFLTVDVAGPDDTRYLAHRGGGGHDGLERPMQWSSLGMLRASVIAIEEQLKENHRDHDDGEGDEGPDE